MNLPVIKNTLSTLLVSALMAVGPAHADDAEMRKEVFANDYVTVNRITLAPGAGLPLHEGAARVVYSLSDYTIEWTEDGSTTSMDWREGQVHAHAALEHAVENTGNTIADLLIVSRTDKPLADAAAGSDASTVAGGYGALIADLDGVRVIRVALPPGARQPMHGGTARLVYALNDSELTFVDAAGKARKFTHETGTAHWHEAGDHAVENTGGETARYVIFAFSQE
jgi:hypothetical protein